MIGKRFCTRLTISMGMGDEYSIYSSKAILGEPLAGSSLKVLANVYDDRPGVCQPNAQEGMM